MKDRYSSGSQGCSPRSLDEIRAIADGKVVHVNAVAGYSNYGKIHSDRAPLGRFELHSLCGHLSSMLVQPGATVTRGQPIAVMGYTGVGINQERAHLHLELDLMFSREFDSWQHFSK
jgi:murein DD-endopeptidase MepM/ murein hydrolase activator NlpD